MGPSASTRPASSSRTRPHVSKINSRSWAAITRVTARPWIKRINSRRPRDREKWTAHRAAECSAASPECPRAPRALLAAREMKRHALLKTRQAHFRERGTHAAAHLVGRESEIQRAERHVVENGGIEDLVVAVLKDDAEMSWQAAAFRGVGGVESHHANAAQPGRAARRSGIEIEWSCRHRWGPPVPRFHHFVLPD